MSYWISLIDSNGNNCTTTSHEHGAVMKIGGSDQCEMCITGNYSRVYPIRDLHGKSGAETIAPIFAAVEELGTETDPDYWAWTPGNVGATLQVLGRWATEHPDGMWEMRG